MPPPGDADDRGDGVGVGERLGGQAQPEVGGVVVEQVEEFGPAQRPVFVGEPDSAVQLGLAGQASLQPTEPRPQLATHPPRTGFYPRVPDGNPVGALAPHPTCCSPCD